MYHSIEVCLHQFKKEYLGAKSVSVKQVYNWVNEGKIYLKKKDLYYKNPPKKKRSGMMEHFVWNLEIKQYCQ